MLLELQNGLMQNGASYAGPIANGGQFNGFGNNDPFTRRLQHAVPSSTRGLQQRQGINVGRKHRFEGGVFNSNPGFIGPVNQVSMDLFDQ